MYHPFPLNLSYLLYYYILKYIKRRWITVIRSPDIFPLPPLEKVEKPHAVFVGKVRKVLPHSKFMEINPKDIYIGRERIGSG